MLDRRRFAACALCAAFAGLAAAPAGAQAPGFRRSTLRQAEYPDDRHVILQVLIDVDPGAAIAPHTHPGVETAYILEGEGTLSVRGQADTALKAGGGFQIPPGVPHGVRNGPARMRLLSVYVVEKDKPLASPAPG